MRPSHIFPCLALVLVYLVTPSWTSPIKKLDQDKETRANISIAGAPVDTSSSSTSKQATTFTTPVPHGGAVQSLALNPSITTEKTKPDQPEKPIIGEAVKFSRTSTPSSTHTPSSWQGLAYPEEKMLVAPSPNIVDVQQQKEEKSDKPIIGIPVHSIGTDIPDATSTSSPLHGVDNPNEIHLRNSQADSDKARVVDIPIKVVLVSQEIPYVYENEEPEIERRGNGGVALAPPVEPLVRAPGSFKTSSGADINFRRDDSVMDMDETPFIYENVDIEIERRGNGGVTLAPAVAPLVRAPGSFKTSTGATINFRRDDYDSGSHLKVSDHDMLERRSEELSAEYFDALQEVVFAEAIARRDEFESTYSGLSYLDFSANFVDTISVVNVEDMNKRDDKDSDILERREEKKPVIGEAVTFSRTAAPTAIRTPSSWQGVAYPQEQILAVPSSNVAVGEQSNTVKPDKPVIGEAVKFSRTTVPAVARTPSSYQGVAYPKEKILVSPLSMNMKAINVDELKRRENGEDELELPGESLFAIPGRFEAYTGTEVNFRRDGSDMESGETPYIYENEEKEIERRSNGGVALAPPVAPLIRAPGSFKTSTGADINFRRDDYDSGSDFEDLPEFSDSFKEAAGVITGAEEMIRREIKLAPAVAELKPMVGEAVQFTRTAIPAATRTPSSYQGVVYPKENILVAPSTSNLKSINGKALKIDVSNQVEPIIQETPYIYENEQAELERRTNDNVALAPAVKPLVRIPGSFKVSNGANVNFRRDDSGNKLDEASYIYENEKNDLEPRLLHASKAARKHLPHTNVLTNTKLALSINFEAAAFELMLLVLLAIMILGFGLFCILDSQKKRGGQETENRYPFAFECDCAMAFCSARRSVVSFGFFWDLQKMITKCFLLDLPKPIFVLVLYTLFSTASLR